MFAKKFRRLAALSAAVALAPATAAQAEVDYLYSTYTHYLQFKLPGFLKAGDTILPQDTAYCVVVSNYVCKGLYATKGIDPQYGTATDILTFEAYDPNRPTDIYRVTSYWTPGLWTQSGRGWMANHTSSGMPVTLIVSGEPSPIASVPEPSTWGLLIIGFGMVGVGLRRTRRVAFQPS